MTKGITLMGRWDLVFADSPSSIWPQATSRCRIKKKPCGWSSMARFTISQTCGSELKSFGHVFRTDSDTEVIVHGYKQWGDDVLNRLNGMFGLAIWDTRQKRLMIARDPFGIKLIYYRIDGDRLYFGSEMRAVRAAMQDSADIEPTSLNLFLRYRFTPSPYTILRGVHKLAPGTKLVAQNGCYKVSQWYQFKPAPFAPPKSADEAKEELLTLYKQAIRRQLISDVPVGLLLSGGIDSGLLLALMNLNGSSWPTYTVGYGSSYADDELADGAETARLLGLKTHIYHESPSQSSTRRSQRLWRR